MEKSQKSKLQELENSIRHHSRKYFQDHSPEISDKEFDRLVEKLRKMHPESAVLSEIADSQWFNSFAPVTRTAPMLSLSKAYSQEEVLDWCEELYPVVAMPKVDGCAISLVYDSSGNMIQASTRGDGTVGEDITLNAKTISGVLHSVEKGNIEVRGEAYMPLSVFQRFSQDFANPRNLAAGALHRKFASECADYELKFVAYDIQELGEERSLACEMEKHFLLEELGFETLDAQSVFGQDAVPDAIKFFEEKRKELDYEIDGVVFKVESVSVQKLLGANNHHPKYATAYKFPGEEAETTLKGVEWSISRTGRLSPVAVVEPVRLSGASISRVSMHTAALFLAGDYSEGDTLLVSRRGGVIPYIEKKTASGSKRLEIPQYCRFCLEATTELRGEFLHCTQPEKCPGAIVERLRYFIDTIGCDGFGFAVVDTLWAAGVLEKPIDFWRLAEESFSGLLISMKVAKKLLDRLAQFKSFPLETILCAMGIEGLGSVTSKAVARKLKNLEVVLEAQPGKFMEIDGIGEKQARSIFAGLQKMRDWLEPFQEYIGTQEVLQSGPFEGKSFLFTGSLEKFTRQEAENRVESLGGFVASSVSKNLDYLVVGENAGSKMKKAEKFVKEGKLKILDQNSWLQMMDQEAL